LCHSREGGNPEPRHMGPLDARFRGHDNDVSESSSILNDSRDYRLRHQFERRAESTPIGQNLDVYAVAAPDLGMDYSVPRMGQAAEAVLRRESIGEWTPSSHRSIPDLDRSRSIKRRSIDEMSSALVAGTSRALLEKRT
jgi:hypothetical protein